MNRVQNKTRQFFEAVDHPRLRCCPIANPHYAIAVRSHRDADHETTDEHAHHGCGRSHGDAEATDPDADHATGSIL